MPRAVGEEVEAGEGGGELGAVDVVVPRQVHHLDIRAAFGFGPTRGERRRASRSGMTSRTWISSGKGPSMSFPNSVSRLNPANRASPNQGNSLQSRLFHPGGRNEKGNRRFLFAQSMSCSDVSQMHFPSPSNQLFCSQPEAKEQSIGYRCRRSDRLVPGPGGRGGKGGASWAQGKWGVCQAKPNLTPSLRAPYVSPRQGGGESGRSS